MTEPTINQVLQRALSDTAKGVRSFASQAEPHLRRFRERVAGLTVNPRGTKDSDG
jgi:hypothetical protein